MAVTYRALWTTSLGAFLVWLAVVAAPADSLAILLEKPIACQFGVDCFVQNYVDLAKGPDYADAMCGPLSYDKHKGTDFRVPFARMQSGVAVLAAAPGVVRATRDGVEDISIRQGGVEATANRECGNGVVLVHPDGMETQYCHLRQGSIRVKTGDRVATGQMLGLVGLSGRTEFPHLHFEVRLGGTSLCPFTGRPLEGGCDGPGKKPLWSDRALAALPYVPAGGLASGFGDEPPDINAVFVGGGKPEVLTSLSPELLYWAGFWGVRRGDVIRMQVVTPTGEVWSMPPRVVQRNQAQLVLTLSKKRAGPWPVGTYTGEAVLTRQGPDGTVLTIPLSGTVTLSDTRN